ncbi:MAG: MFS transporter [Alphaproteobacteria bacterium]|nr:MFS transporter [Alphaproteobacteria bacterium]
MLVEKSIDQDNYPEWRSWATWGCAGIFFFYQFVVRVSPSVFATEIMKELEISACTYSAMGSIYYLSYSSVQLFVGLILDRLGVRYPLIFASLLIFAGCMIFSYSDDVDLLFFSRFIIGVGSALGFLSCVKTASMWFSSERLGLMIGLSVMIGMAGGTCGGYPMAYLVEMVGWRQSMYILALIAGAIVVLTFVLARDRKNPVEMHAQESEHKYSILQSLIVLVKNPQTYLYAIYGALMFVPISVFLDVWGVKYLEMIYGVSVQKASGAASMTYVGIGASGPLLAIVTDRWRSYKKLMILGSVLSLFGFTAIIYTVLPSFAYIYPLFFVTGFALGAQFFAFSSIVEINPRQVSATASGLQNMANMFGSGAVLYGVGLVLDYVSDGRVDNVISRYVVEDFHIALSIIPASILLACLLLVFVREAYPKDSVVVR